MFHELLLSKITNCDLQLVIDACYSRLQRLFMVGEKIVYDYTSRAVFYVGKLASI